MTSQAGTSRQQKEAEILGLLHTSWDLVSKRNSEIAELSARALALAEQIKSKNLIGLCLLEGALYQCLVKSDYPLSIKQSEEGFALMKGNFKKRYAPYYHLNIGRNYHFMGDHVSAQRNYLECVKQLEALSERNVFESKWLAHSYYNLYILFNFSGAEFAQEEYLQKALQLYKQIDDVGGQGNCYNSYAVYYFRVNALQESYDNLKRAYALAEQERAISLLSIYSANIGLVLVKMGDLETGLAYFDKAQAYDDELESPYHHAHTQNQMGEAYIILERYSEAIERFSKALQYFEAIGVKRSIANTYEQMAKAYAGLRNFEQAYHYQLLYGQSLKDVFNDEKTFAVAKARNDFELEIRDQEAKKLRLKNRQIEQYARQLEMSNNELRQFAHVASHDLREPLRMVSSYVQLLQRTMDSPLTKDQREFMQFIMQGTQTMQNLISDLLALAAISNVRETELIDLNKIIQQVQSSLQPVIKERHAKIKSTLLPSVVADETHMLQLFMNLISNGIKYNTSDQPVIDITYSMTGRYYQFAVADNGIGIPAEYRDKIFLIFQRLHSREEYSGTGIGLAICKKIVDQAGGTIRVSDRQDGGSIFVFTLPVAERGNQ
jgi:signal transduction histidine kinase